MTIHELFHLAWIVFEYRRDTFLVFLFRRLAEQSNLFGHRATFKEHPKRKISRVFSTILFSTRRYFRHVALSYVDQRFLRKSHYPLSSSYRAIIVQNDSRFRNRISVWRSHSLKNSSHYRKHLALSERLWTISFHVSLT